MPTSNSQFIALRLGSWFRPTLYLLNYLVDRLERGRLTIVAPDGMTRTVEGREPSGIHAVLEIKRSRALRRFLFGGETGFAEAYLDGDWTTPDLSALMELAVINDSELRPVNEGATPARVYNRIRHLVRANTRRGSRRNIAHHYDLGNAFYALWLDRTMTYSSALFEEDVETLEDAQKRKCRRLAQALDLQPDHHVLEIGCGWGGFAEIAAREFGCRVTGITLSHEQAAYMRQRVCDAGLAERVDVVIRDYRDVGGHFDRIASIEMFEAVGEKYWPAYFKTVRERLKPGGMAGLQIITIADERFEEYRRGSDFVQKYIFPGGMLPCPSALSRVIEAAGLAMKGVETFGQSYAMTLGEWQRRFQRVWDRIETMGFDVRFKRMWEVYLAYCEAGFRHGPLDVGQYVLVRP